MQIQATESISSSIARPVGDVAGITPQQSSHGASAITPPPAASAHGTVFAARMEQNQAITSAQRALVFLDQSVARLQGLKAAISSQLSGNLGDRSGIAGQVEAFALLWEQRGKATGGSLDARLNLVGADSARARFRIAGLDMSSLLSGNGETLTFYPGGLTRASVSIQIDAGMAQDAALARLNQGLAEAGINVIAGQDGSLTFSARESQLPLLREQLLVKGGGIRFPSGQPNHVNLQPVEQALTPARWKTDSQPALRNTLKSVVDGLGKVLQARQTAQDALADSGQAIATETMTGGAQWAESFSSQFRDVMSRSGSYNVFSSLAPAVQGVTRHRVNTLLALR